MDGNYSTGDSHAVYWIDGGRLRPATSDETLRALARVPALDLIVPKPGMPAGCVIDLAAVKRAMLREAPASAELADLLIGLAKGNPWFAELLVKLVP